MPDQQNVSFTEACKRFDEAIRAIEKYMYNVEKEPNALLDPTLDKYNGVYYVNPCMYHKKGAKNISKGLKEFYKKKTGRDAKANTSICTAIVTMPKNFIQAHYNLSDREYVLMEKYVQEEKLNSDELKEVKKIQKKMVHIEWTPEEMREIHMYFKAMEKAYCITAGIKGCEVKEDKNGNLVEDYSNSDILWSISHLSESWPHWHFGFLPMSYIREEQMGVLEKYKNDKEERNKKVEELVARGVSSKEAAKMELAIKQPKVLYGNTNRKIEASEVPVGCSVKKYSKGYLHALNRRLEERMLEQGIETHIANGKGNQFNLAKTGKQKRFEESTKDKMIDELQRRAKELERELSSKAELLEEKDIEIKEMEEKINSLRDVITELQNALKNLVKEVVMFIPNIIKEFLYKWNGAKTISQMKKVDDLAEAKATAGAEEMAKPLKDLAKQAEALLEDDVVNGVNMATFERTKQKEGFAKNQIVKAAKARGQEESFQEGSRMLAFALEDWYDREKHEKAIKSMSELDASLYMKFPTRASRAFDYAMEKAREMEDMELE